MGRLTILVLLCCGGIAHAAMPWEGRLVAFEGSEGLSALYRFVVEFDVGDEIVPVNENLLDGALKFDLPGGQSIHGIVRRISLHPGADGAVRYRIELGPRVADLALQSGYRVFSDRTVVDIVTELLNEAGQVHEWQLSGDYPARDQVVQYGESTWDFLRRLLADNGIYFYFVHSDDEHRMVLRDDSTAGHPSAGQLTLRGRAPNLIDLGFSKAVYAGRANLIDYNPQTAEVMAVAAAAGPFELLQREYPGGYRDQAVGQTLVNRRMQSREAAGAAMSGASTSAAVRAGHVATVSGHPEPADVPPLLITAVEHRFEGRRYDNDFLAQPATIPYRPPRQVPAPRAALDVGFVSGATSEEIQVDEQGRVQVRFPWSAPGQTLRARVVQPGTDSLWIPRINEEVLVTFVNGDPSRPVVVGSLYNAVRQPPYALPAAKTLAVWRAVNTPAVPNQPRVANEIRMDARTDAELLQIKAARDLYTITRGDHRLKVEKDQQIEVAGSQAQLIAGSQKNTIEGDQEQTIKGSQQQQIGGSQSAAVAGNLEVKAGGVQALKARELVLDAGQRIRLRVGSNELVIDRDGIRQTEAAKASAPIRKPTQQAPRQPLKQVPR